MCGAYRSQLLQWYGCEHYEYQRKSESVRGPWLRPKGVSLDSHLETRTKLWLRIDRQLRRKWGESEVDNESGAAYESNTEQTGRHEAEQNSKTKWPRQDDKNSKHRRPKPGAALAMAKRENVAIVPSEGTRLTFTWYHNLLFNCLLSNVTRVHLE